MRGHCPDARHYLSWARDLGSVIATPFPPICDPSVKQGGPQPGPAHTGCGGSASCLSRCRERWRQSAGGPADQWGCHGGSGSWCPGCWGGGEREAVRVTRPESLFLLLCPLQRSPLTGPDTLSLQLPAGVSPQLRQCAAETGPSELDSCLGLLGQGPAPLLDRASQRKGPCRSCSLQRPVQHGA